MAVGYPKDKANVDSVVGELTRAVNRVFRKWEQFNTELDTYTDGQLTTAGYTAGEITTLRTAADDMMQLSNIYKGAATLGTAKDFRANLSPGWGVLGDD